MFQDRFEQVSKDLLTTFTILIVNKPKLTYSGNRSWDWDWDCRLTGRALTCYVQSFPTGSRKLLTKVEKIFQPFHRWYDGPT